MLRGKLFSTLRVGGARAEMTNSALNTGMNLVGAGCILLLMVILCTDILLRTFFSSGVPAAWEIGSTLLVLIVAFGLAYTQKRRAHITLKMLTARLSARHQQTIDLVASIIGLLLLATMAWVGWLWAWDSWVNQEHSEGVVGFPLYVAKYIFAIGLSAGAIQHLVDIVKGVALRLRRG